MNAADKQYSNMARALCLAAGQASELEYHPALAKVLYTKLYEALHAIQGGLAMLNTYSASGDLPEVYEIDA